MIDIPNEEHVTRFCPKYTLDEYGIPTGDAFKLRKDETYISVDWYEFFIDKNNKIQDIQIFSLIKEAMIKRNFTPAKNGIFSFHSVGVIKTKEYKNINFEVKNIDKTNSHSGIFPNPTSLYQSEMIAETVKKIIPLDNLK